MSQRLHRTLILSRPATAWVLALVVFVLIFAGGHAVLRANLQERENRRQIEAMSQASALHVRLEGEINAQVKLVSGLAAYLAVRNDNLDIRELQKILAELHRQSRYMRNIAVAIDVIVRSVYPVEGNEKAIGVRYPDLPDQWPLVELVIRSSRAAMAGPVDLVQGGRGLIYREPIHFNGHYWGLLSVVLDPDALFAQVHKEFSNPRYEFAIRGADGKGLGGGPVWGDPGVFDRDKLLVHYMGIPGGQWAIAVRPVETEGVIGLYLHVYGLTLLFASSMATLVFMLLRNRRMLTHRALHDALTDLPNRHLFEDRALMAFTRQQRRPDQACALLFLDLDDFKGINDHFGHKAGDAVLKCVAERAQAAVRQGDTVARWGGDEFIVLLENFTPDMLRSIAGRLRDSIQEPFEYQGNIVRVGTSIGVALYPKDGRTLDELLHAADYQMYTDKSDRRSGGYSRRE